MNKLIAKISFLDIAIALAIAIFFTLDRWLKLLALGSAGATPVIFGDVLSFHFIANYYMAFSLPLGGWILNAAIILIIVALAVYAAYLQVERKEMRTDIILTLFIIVGALSNLTDRLRYGYVIDYLDLRYFTIFNLSDILITLSAGLLIWRNLRHK